MAMAEKLGILLDGAGQAADAEPEYCLLWIAVEALRAPLPPLWRRTADGKFEHSATHEATDEHPMLPVFAAHVVHERQRKRTTRPFASLERFMLFAAPTEPGGDPAAPGESGFVFYNFATRQALPARRLPSEAVAEQLAKRPPPKPPKKRAFRATESSKHAMHADKKKAEAEREAAEKAEKAARLAPKRESLSESELASLRSHAGVVRRTALAVRPRSLPELMVAARMLQIDLVADPGLLWLVDLCLACDYLPCGWEGVPREQMVQMAKEPSGEAKQPASPGPGGGGGGGGHGGGGGGLFAFGGNKKDEPRPITWLPPIERLWHVATTGSAPPQYSHQMCALTTERHPLHGFVRMVLGLDHADGVK
jgi:hypothetical protein